MKLQDMTWPEVEAASREAVVLIPTGSFEQHGPHLPLFTDSIIVTAVAEAVEAKLPKGVLLTPTLWLGASGHHLTFPGTLSNNFDAYMGAIDSVVESLLPHGFYRFYLLNGHGGNSEPNGIAVRRLKERHREVTFIQTGYFAHCERKISELMDGPLKVMRHACEAESSLMLHLRPELVRRDKLRDDGLVGEPTIQGMIHFFDEQTEEGCYGFATLATAEKGQAILQSAVDGVAGDIAALLSGYVLKGIARNESQFQKSGKEPGSGEFNSPNRESPAI